MLLQGYDLKNFHNFEELDICDNLKTHIRMLEKNLENKDKYHQTMCRILQEATSYLKLK